LINEVKFPIQLSAEFFGDLSVTHFVYPRSCDRYRGKGCWRSLLAVINLQMEEKNLFLSLGCKSGLPDGILSNQKSQFGYILVGLRMENVGIFYGNFEYYTANWYILRPLGNGVFIWYIFPRFGILCQEKSGNPDANSLTGFTSLCVSSLSFSPRRRSMEHFFLLTRSFSKFHAFLTKLCCRM
jgi:hypothetical protein